MLGACSAPQGVRAARSGELGEVRRLVLAERAAGTLTRPRVRALARATAEREIAQPDASAAAARIEQATGCARQLEGGLGERARGNDDAAAAALLALLDADEGVRRDRSDDVIAAHARASNASFRALAARAAVGSEQGALRRAFYLDPDERVRLAALRAALDRTDPADARALLTVVRLDPNALAQSLAARALGGIASAEVVLGLADVYPGADESLRQSIVDAWGMRARSAGGVRELVRVLETEHSMAATEAAAVLLRTEPQHEAAPLAARALVRAIDAGTENERVLAIHSAPAQAPGARDALSRAAHARGARARGAALVRLGDAPARAELRRRAQGGDVPALLGLAELGDRAATDGLAKLLTSGPGPARLTAARALVALGEEPRAAELLADRDPAVRMSIACAIVARD